MILLVLLIKAYVVQLTYNMMWPKIVENSGGDTSRFKPLTFYEALMMVILFSFLFDVPRVPSCSCKSTGGMMT